MILVGVRMPILTGLAEITGSESYATARVRLPILTGPTTITGSESYATASGRMLILTGPAAITGSESYATTNAANGLPEVWPRPEHSLRQFLLDIQSRSVTVNVLRFSLNKIETPTLPWLLTGRPAVTSDLLLPLELLQPGEWADVADVQGEPAWVCRLAELGLGVGCRLQMLQAGCPCLLRIGGCRLSLRAEARQSILVRPVLGPA